MMIVLQKQALLLVIYCNQQGGYWFYIAQVKEFVNTVKSDI